MLLSTGLWSLSLPASASAGDETKEEEKEREKREKELKKERERAEKEEERLKKEAKKRTEEAKKYATLQEFALDHYAGEPDFHDDVDQAYADLQAHQALEAFNINTSKPAEIIEKDGDILKIRRQLYDNPRVQDFVNRIGQRLVPTDSDKLYAFKVIQSPVPTAYTLSTGTIYISTGLISLIDNEAQLAYVLSHELAHVYKDHWKLKVMAPLAEEEYNRRQEKKRALWGAVFAGIGAGVGAIARGKEGIPLGATAGFASGYLIGTFMSRKLDVDWFTVQENEADDFALKNTLERNYDVQEVPKLYLALTRLGTADQRVGLGFMGNRKRVKERMDHVQKLLQADLQPTYQQKLKAGQLLGASPDYQLMMAELKRDNGILAFYFDMFNMAQQNLRQAVNLRTDDARARYYYGKVMKLVARSDADKELAKREVIEAIKLDQHRRTLPEAELQQALILMDSPDTRSQSEAIEALKNYITAYQQNRVQEWKYSGSLPSNMETLYDYLRLLGEPKWKPQMPDVYRVVTAEVGAGGTVAAMAPSHEASVAGSIKEAKGEQPQK